MGLILSRFYDKPSPRDTLEKIEQELQNIQERKWDKIKREQFVVQILSFIPITIIIANVCILIYPSDSSWRDKLLYSVPIVLLNLALWACKKVVQWYSQWSLDNEEARLRKLQKEKKRILEMVCETESYRVAAELLEKYDPKQLRHRDRNLREAPTASTVNTTLTKFTASPKRNSVQQQPVSQPQTSLAQTSFLNQSLSLPVQPIRQIPAPPPPTPMNKPAPKVPVPPSAALNTTISSLHNTSIASPVVAASSVQGRPVRPILSKDRSLFERLVDWVVADGPDNRFALICRYCYGHNGMSLAEEYETINFRCCYCYNLNTATNKRHQVHDQLQPEREKSGPDQGATEQQSGANSENKDSDLSKDSAEDRDENSDETKKEQQGTVNGKTQAESKIMEDKKQQDKSE